MRFLIIFGLKRTDFRCSGFDEVVIREDPEPITGIRLPFPTNIDAIGEYEENESSLPESEVTCEDAPVSRYH